MRLAEAMHRKGPEQQRNDGGASRRVCGCDRRVLEGVVEEFATSAKIVATQGI